MLTISSLGTQRLDEFCRNHHALAAHWARSVVRGEDAIDECVQRAFVRAALNIHMYDESRPFRPWFKVVLVRECLGYLRGNKHDVCLDDCHDMAGPGIDELVSFEREENQRQANEIWQQSQGLKELYLWIVRAIDYVGMSHDEVCEILGYKPDAFSTVLHRARKSMRTRMAAA